MRLSFLFLLLPAALSGCKVATPASRMGEANIAAPGAWSATREARAGVDDDWVARLGSPRLSALVNEAQANNPDLKIAAARVDQARSLVKSAIGEMRPTLEVEGLGNTNQRNFVGFPLPGSEDGVTRVRTDSFSLNFVSNWELDIWGRYRAGAGAAVAFAQSAEQDERAARAAIAAQTARAYFLLLEANEQVALAEESIAAQAKTEELLGGRFAGGLGDSNLGAQLRLARSDLSAARAALDARKEVQGQAARALEVLLGRYPQGDRHRGERLPALTGTPPAGLPSELLQRRPDILAAERRFAAQGMRQKEARRAVWPSLKLTASGGTSTAALGDLLKSDFGVWSMGARVFEPILTGGRVKAEIEKRQSEEEEALASLQKTVLAGFTEVENTLASEQLLRSREAALQEAAHMAGEADTSARAAFSGGIDTADALTVLVAQQRAIQSRSAVAAVRRLRLDNRVALHLALGGDFRVH